MCWILYCLSIIHIFSINQAFILSTNAMISCKNISYDRRLCRRCSHSFDIIEINLIHIIMKINVTNYDFYGCVKNALTMLARFYCHLPLFDLQLLLSLSLYGSRVFHSQFLWFYSREMWCASFAVEIFKPIKVPRKSHFLSFFMGSIFIWISTLRASNFRTTLNSSLGFSSAVNHFHCSMKNAIKSTKSL